MRMQRVWTSLSLCVLMVAATSSAQQTRKAGLWQVATTTKIQQQGETPGNFVTRPNGSESSGPDGGLAVCLTQEVIDAYGVILPPSLKDCDLSNVVQSANSFRADMTCKGGYNGVGSVESNWTDEDHVTGKVRFVSKTRETTSQRALTWTQEGTAVFKSSDCGSVKPRKVPAKQP